MDKTTYVLISACFLCLSGMVQARDFKDVNVPESVMLDGTNTNISLNGVGMRTKFFFDIYIGAMYLESAVKTRDDALSQKGPKRIFMHFLYDEVTVEKLVAGWNEGFEENLSEQQLAGLAERIQKFNAMFNTAHAGDEVLLDYLPGLGTRVTIKGKIKGVIEGEDFNHALLNIWLGDEPADDGLKEAMLNTED